MILSTLMDPANLVPWHEVTDPAKRDALAADMTANGWTGSPIVAILGGQDDRALTGVHRLAAARIAEIEVPVIDLNDLLTDTGTSLDQLIEDRGNEYEALMHLDYYLPDRVIDAYGIDLH